MSHPQDQGRGIIYTRVSTNPQEKGTSLDAQFAACRLKADALGVRVIGIERDIETGASLVAREGLLRAIEQIERGEADTLLVYDMSRYSRDMEHQQSIRRRVEAAGGRIVFATRDYGDSTDPQGRLSFGIDGLFADYERFVIRKRMHEGKKARARSGIQPYRNISPFGYVVVTTQMVLDGQFQADQIGRYIVVEHLAPIVREMFSRYASGASLRGLRDWLNAQGLPSPRNSKQGWNPDSIAFILRNPAYVGRPEVGRRVLVSDDSRVERGVSRTFQRRAKDGETITLSCTPIVDEATWSRVAQRLSANLPTQRGRKYLLSGLLRCPGCGKRMYGTMMRTRPYKSAPREVRDQARADTSQVLSSEQGHLGHRVYRCEQNRNTKTTLGTVPSECKASVLRANEIEAAFIDTLLSTLADSNALRAVLEEERKKQARPTSDTTRLDGLLKAHKDLDRKEEALVDAQLRTIEAGGSSAIYEQRLRALHAQRLHLRSEIDSLQTASPEISSQTVEQRQEELSSALEAARTVLVSDQVPVVRKHALLSEIIAGATPEVEPVATYRGARTRVLAIKLHFRMS